MGKVLVFTDSIGEEFEIRHIVKVSTRLHGVKFYETNDGTWFSQDELKEQIFKLDYIKEKDLIATSSKSGTSFPLTIELFNRVAEMADCSHYNYEEHYTPTPLPQGL